MASNEEVANLTRNAADNVTFPFPVMGIGFLSLRKENSKSVIAEVIDQKLTIKDYTGQFSHRIYWDNKTGFFTIINLQKKDSNHFSIDSKDNRSIFSYNLQVNGE